MSSPDNSATGKGEDVVHEGDGNGEPAPEEPSRKNDSPPPSNGDQSSGLSDDLETESSEEEVLLSPDKRAAALISGGEIKLEDSPSTPKKVKQDTDSARLQESPSTCKASGSDPEGSSSLKKDPASPDSLLLSPDRKASSSTSRDIHTPEKQAGKETDAKIASPILKQLLQCQTLSPLRDQNASTVPSNASDEQSTQPQDASNCPALAMVMGGLPLSPLRDPPESSLPSDASGQSTQSQAPSSLPDDTLLGSAPLSPVRDPPASSVHPNASGQSAQSQSPSYEPGKNAILLDCLGKPPLIPSHSSAGTNAPSVSNPSEGNRECVSERVKKSPIMIGLLTKGTQGSSSTQGATGLNIPPQTSSHPSTSEPKDKLVLSDPSTGTKKTPDMQEMDDSSEDGGSEEDIGSEEPRSPVKPADVTDGSAMDIDEDNSSGLPLGDAPLAESESSSDLDETPEISKRISSRSPSQRSKNAASADTSGVSSQTDSMMNISPEASLDDDTFAKNSKGTGRMQTRSDNLESIKQGDSSKVTTGRKSKLPREAKKSSGGETSSSADQSTSSVPEVAQAIDSDDKVFKKPSVTPLRLQKMKSRLEDINLDDSSSVTNSPSRRSARIQSKESGESSKESSLEKEGKNLRPRTGGRAASDEGAKASGEKSKSLSRERISKLKASESSGSRSESMERAKPKTRSREDTPKKREQSGSRGHASSEESVARRTRGARLASTSSNSETEKPEEDETETPRGVRKSRKDSGK